MAILSLRDFVLHLNYILGPSIVDNCFMVAMATFKAFNSFLCFSCRCFLYFWQHFPDNHKFITSHSTAVIFSFPSINDEIKYFYLLLSFLCLNSLFACNTDKDLMAPDRSPISVSFDNESGVYELKTGRQLTVTPIVANAVNPRYKWVDDRGTTVASGLTLSFRHRQRGCSISPSASMPTTVRPVRRSASTCSQWWFQPSLCLRRCRPPLAVGLRSHRRSAPAAMNQPSTSGS